ncbi:MAG: hypothetical protein RIB53_13640 [Roseitalea porphyridii]|jgi:hypothetical protein|uniref:hypothetical protein n=1 Tax=Roseitalea porphyridii TaxID=1852022 RepID=UPI0032D9925A
MNKSVFRARRSGPAPFAWAALAVGAIVLAGCTIPAPGGGGGFGGPSAVSRAGPLDGNWSDSSGVATASLLNGRFVSVANDTGNRVAEGTYTYTSRESIALDYFSLLRETRIRANCVLAGSTTLNCTNDSGQQFQLIRRSGVG